MFGQGGIVNAARNSATIDPIQSSTFENSDDSGSKVQAWKGFKSLVKRLKHLEAELDGEEFETLLSIDDSSEILNNLETLSLYTPEEDGFSILEDPTSKFPTLLSTLHNLKSLTIHKTLILSSGERFLPPLSAPALSTPYSFCSTLTSFSHFSTPSSLNSKIDLDFLRFLTRFPILRHLKISSNSCDIDPKESQNPILLPNVIDLELIGYDKIYVGIDSVLDYLKLPKLSSLTLDYDLNKDFYHTVEGIEIFKKLKKRILDLGSPFLKNVYLSGNSFQGIYKSILDMFQQEQGEGLSYTVYTDFQPGLPEAFKSFIIPNSRINRQAGFSNQELVEGMVDGIEKLNQWIKEECERGRKDNDTSRLQHLLHALTPVWDLQEWSKD
ncbi:hypothetical protein JCM5350_008000 [Sporobolomyces pararoseus]